MMRDRDFYLVWMDALEREKAAFVSNWTLSSVWDDPEEISDEAVLQLVAELENIWDVAHMSVKDICKEAGLTQGQLAARFRIPKRTVEDWCRGISKCAGYTRLMMAECLGVLKVDRSNLSRLQCNVSDPSVRNLCAIADLSQGQLAVRFCIPKRTVEDWCRGVSKCANYTRLMMAECLGVLGNEVM